VTDSVGFIGLGIMGAPMVRNLLSAGFEVTVWNRTRAKSEEATTHGASIGESPADVAARSDVTITCVTATDDVAVMLIGGDDAPPPVIEGIRVGSVVIDMSTISPAATREFAGQLAARGAQLLDAPVSGGEQGAINGTLSIMLGGEEDALERVRPILEAIGSQITHCGPSGTGQTVKLCNQIVVCINNFAMAEALLFCEASGVDPSTMLEAISAGAAGSWQISNLGSKVVDRDFAPGFKVGLQQKDLRLALEAADQLRLPLTGTSMVHQLFAAVERASGSDVGTQALVRALEAMTGIEVGSGSKSQ
jgi:3-hydroxyisobutyrate dehydrogenase